VTWLVNQIVLVLVLLCMRARSGVLSDTEYSQGMKMSLGGLEILR